MADRFTDEEWSRILSAHAGGQLHTGGEDWLDSVPDQHASACILQAAHIEYNCEDAFNRDQTLAEAFDAQYCDDWSPEGLIAFVASVPRG